MAMKLKKFSKTRLVRGAAIVGSTIDLVPVHSYGWYITDADVSTRIASHFERVGKRISSAADAYGRQRNRAAHTSKAR